MSQRLDKVLVEKKLVSTRHRAADMIKEGKVKVNDVVVTKAAHAVEDSDRIELIQPEMKWVGRGALKLIHALDLWNVDIKDQVALDIGASTGGFTQVLLERGISKIYAVDTGTDQLSPVLRSNPKVINLEKTNALHLTQELVPEKATLCVMDVSFVSALKVLPGVVPFLTANATLILLVKPQFEAGRQALDKKGVVTKATDHDRVLEEVKAGLLKLGFSVEGVADSPIQGGEGNKEFLLLARFSRT